MFDLLSFHMLIFSLFASRVMEEVLAEDLEVRHAREREAILMAYQRYHDIVSRDVGSAASIFFRIRFVDLLQGNERLQTIKRTERRARSILKQMLGYDRTIYLPGERSDRQAHLSMMASVHYAHYAVIGGFLKRIGNAILKIERWVLTTYPKIKSVVFFVDGEYIYTQDHGWPANEARPVFKELSNEIHQTNMEDLVYGVHCLNLGPDNESLDFVREFDGFDSF